MKKIIQGRKPTSSFVYEAESEAEVRATPTPRARGEGYPGEGVRSEDRDWSFTHPNSQTFLGGKDHILF